MTAAFAPYRHCPQHTLGFGDDEIEVDNFAGWGGASTGIEAATGRPVAIAINHNPIAIEMHTVNHPQTLHLQEDVFDVDPVEVCGGRPVGFAWFSPDCRHHSKAKGGKPVEKKIRGLAWVALRWAARKKVRVIGLENVEEFEDWGPLLPNNLPDKTRKGETFRMFVVRLERLGYKVEFRVLNMDRYGIPTRRKRFFLIARRDGQPIAWPEETHADPKSKGFRKSRMKPWIPTYKFLDFSRATPSIFLTKEEGAAIGVKRPLAENTMDRIRRGVFKYCIDDPDPFIIRIGQQGFGGDRMAYSVREPITTFTTKAEHCLVVPTLVSAFLCKNFGGNYKGAGADVRNPAPTFTAKDHNALVTSHMIKFRGSNIGHRADEPLQTLSAGGQHFGEVRAFLIKFYSQGGQWQDLREPVHTILTKDRLGLVTVHGEDYLIVDIGMRMLDPDEMFPMMSFPKNYVISVNSKGQKVPKYQQVAGCGNSVPPGMVELITRLNYTPQRRQEQIAA